MPRARARSPPAHSTRRSNTGPAKAARRRVPGRRLQSAGRGPMPPRWSKCRPRAVASRKPFRWSPPSGMRLRRFMRSGRRRLVKGQLIAVGVVAENVRVDTPIQRGLHLAARLLLGEMLVQHVAEELRRKPVIAFGGETAMHLL